MVDTPGNYEGEKGVAVAARDYTVRVNPCNSQGGLVQMH
jgi:hypothetical protein